MIDMKQIKNNVSNKLKTHQEENMDLNSVAEKNRRVSNGDSPMAIGATIKIKGNVTGDDDLIIHGHVEGDIDLKNHNVIIGKNGNVKANIKAREVVVEGTLNGDLKGEEKVIIKNTGNVLGNVVSPRVTLEDGAMFKGSIEMEPFSSVDKPSKISSSITSASAEKNIA